MEDPPDPRARPAAYGDAFADVYDRWYGAGDASEVITALGRLAPERGSVLEIGSGTGRLSVPLAADGWSVTALDSSDAMHERLVTTADVEGATVEPWTADAGDAAQWPNRKFDVVLAAFNMIFNLTSTAAQRTMFAASAARLADTGVLVVQSFIPATARPGPRQSSLASLDEAAVRAITVQTSRSGVIDGTHVEIRDGELPTTRDWQILPTPVATLDAFASDAGLRLAERWGDFTGRKFDAGVDAHHVSIYRRVEGRPLN